MKKHLLFLFVFLLMFDFSDAQMMFDQNQYQAGNTEVTSADSDDYAKKRRKKRKKRKKGKRGRGSDMGFVAGANLGLGIPMGDLGESTNMGFGGGAEGTYFVQPQLGIGLHTGYYSFGYNDDFTGKGSMSFMPIMPHVQYLFGSSEFKPYAGLGLGMFLEIQNAELSMEMPIGVDPFTGEPIYELVEQTISESRMDLGVAPMVGFYYQLADQLNLNVNLKYNMAFSKIEEMQSDFTMKEVNQNYSFLGINFGIVYTLK